MEETGRQKEKGRGGNQRSERKENRVASQREEVRVRPRKGVRGDGGQRSQWGCSEKE